MFSFFIRSSFIFSSCSHLYNSLYFVRVCVWPRFRFGYAWFWCAGGVFCLAASLYNCGCRCALLFFASAVFVCRQQFDIFCVCVWERKCGFFATCLELYFFHPQFVFFSRLAFILDLVFMIRWCVLCDTHNYKHSTIYLHITLTERQNQRVKINVIMCLWESVFVRKSALVEPQRTLDTQRVGDVLSGWMSSRRVNASRL